MQSGSHSAKTMQAREECRKLIPLKEVGSKDDLTNKPTLSSLKCPLVSIRLIIALILYFCEVGFKGNTVGISTCDAFAFNSQIGFQKIPNRRFAQDVDIKIFANKIPSIETEISKETRSSKDAHDNSSSAEIITNLGRKTVKDLREEVRNLNPAPTRGILSKLKLKKDLIDFLANEYSIRSKVEKDLSLKALSNTSESIETKPKKSIKKRKRLSMPSITSHLANNDETINNDMSNSTTIFKSKKDLIYEEVSERYPGLENYNKPQMDATSPHPHHDVRSRYHPMLVNAPDNSEMDINFIGTASCTPGATRGVSCLALRMNWRRANFSGHNLMSYSNDGRKKKKEQSDDSYHYDFAGGTWIFDAGECTQLQIQKSPNVKAGKVTKIFISHSHGDHSFGLPGLLCLMGQDRPKDPNGNGDTNPPVEIYGPEGLRMWLRVSIRFSLSRIVPKYRVHELMDVPMAPEWKSLIDNSNNRRRFIYDFNRIERSGNNKSWMNNWGNKGVAGEDPFSWITQCRNIEPIEMDSYYGEVEGGRDIYPEYDHPLCANGAPIWKVEDEGDVVVHAAPMSHSVPCVGYVVKESSKPGRLKPELVTPVILRNEAALKKAGVKAPMKIMAVIKSLPPDGAFNFPDGTVIKSADVVEPPREGRKVVVCGDTADARALENLAQNADLVVHEATNTFLEGIDSGTSLYAVTKDARIHGHSTPFMAGDFAKRVNAKKLILNHFSSRYKGDESLDSVVVMTRIEKQALEATGFKCENVAAAWDFMTVPISPNQNKMQNI